VGATIGAWRGAARRGAAAARREARGRVGWVKRRPLTLSRPWPPLDPETLAMNLTLRHTKVALSHPTLPGEEAAAARRRANEARVGTLSAKPLQLVL